MENGGKKITEVRLYNCGCCKNNLRHVFKHHSKEIRMFPARVVLIRHSQLGDILYDTGYSKLIYRNHILSFLYNALNKSYVNEEDTIVSKLKRDGIATEHINQIILSHAHPDHIGGLRLLQNYEIISTEKVIDTLQNGGAFELVFQNMKPDGSVKYRLPVVGMTDSVLNGYFEKIYDVLGDGSILGVELNGHADGQLGIYLPEYQMFFAADACWGADLLCKVKDMRKVAQWIQNDYIMYVDTVGRLERFIKENPEIKVIFSHDTMEEIRYE